MNPRDPAERLADGGGGGKRPANDRVAGGRITLEHGSGGALSRALTEELIYPLFSGPDYPELSDASELSLEGRSFLTTDTYVVDPPEFPGGDIGTLAVHGTCNDLAVCGARPLYLSLGLVLEEGLPLELLRRVLASVRSAAEAGQVRVVTGDTKVVPAGKGGGIYINTAGIGRAISDVRLSPSRIRVGDRVLVSAPVGAHGLAVLAARERLAVGRSLRSDCAFLYPLCSSLCGLGEELRFMRDATRGGVAAVLNETVAGAALGMEVREEEIPVDPAVAAAADLLGLNPLEVANEGVLVAVVSQPAAQTALALLSRHSLGARAAVIGTVTDAHPGRVMLETVVGGRRVLDLPRGLLLPRIC
ncbi:MAG: hydrogenase expression/formation protein HypE [Spirochaetales bacterium]|nr:hydrogenase expression/formation protein HypE [Spirochaetales bacterium]